MTRTKLEVHESASNIFADLGRPDAEAHYLKAQLVAELYRLTGERKLTQAKAADLMGITQPEVSRLFKGYFREYSVDRLLRFLTAFDCDIEIVSRPLASTSLRGTISFISDAGKSRPRAAAKG
jgi:predicted XRE-type DNA-binding protein